MEIHESAYANPEINKDITEDGPQSHFDSNISEVSNGRKPTSAVAGILGAVAGAIGGLLGLRFLSKRKTNASKTSDLVLLLEPSSPKFEEDPTPVSDQPPKREEDQDEEEPVSVFAAGDPPKDEQVEVIDHPPVLEEGVQSEDETSPSTSDEGEQPKEYQDEEYDDLPILEEDELKRSEKVRKFLKDGFRYIDEVVIFLNAVRDELCWTSRKLSQFIHACTKRSFTELGSTTERYPRYIEEYGFNKLLSDIYAASTTEYRLSYIPHRLYFDLYKAVVYDLYLEYKKGHPPVLLLKGLLREHKINSKDYDPVSLDPL
jgi:hypothetical protein